MRVLWLLCLTGSIICAPLDKGLGSNSAQTQLFPWYTFRGTGSSELRNSSDQAPEHNRGGPGYMNYRVQSHPLVTRYEVPAASPDGYVVGQYGAPAASPDGYVMGQYGAPAAGPDGYVVGQYQAAPVNFNSASGASGEENQPVFSDMSDLDPVYSISSRSRYQKGRAVFAQTRYIPTDSLGLSMPLFPYTSYMFAPQGNPHTVGTTMY